MHLDNAVNKSTNPRPGQVYNWPDGPDVYKGIPKHYTGQEVNPTNVLAVLRGDQSLKHRGKKVLESGPLDNIFVYLMTHGGPQVLAFPYGGYLFAKDIIATFKDMYANRRYRQLVIHVEACESGSMFQNIMPPDIGVYAVASSQPTQMSRVAGYDSKLMDFTAGYFAITWLNHTEDRHRELLDDQFDYIRSQTAKDYYDPYTGLKWHQNAGHYGNLSIGRLDIGQFEGPKPYKIATGGDSDHHNDDEHRETVSMRDVQVVVAEKRLLLAVSTSDKLRAIDQLKHQLLGRQLVNKLFEQFAGVVGQLLSTTTTTMTTGLDSQLLVDQELVSNCYELFVNTFQSKCFNMNKNPYVLGKLNVFVNICEHLTARQLAIALNQLVGQCETTNAIVGH
ncbi:legumain-like [Oppia nitens]|uniref:legumain-like n=1 Tax=Oppia nitens TaxID=1686743 RepID=UPI0023D98AF5|nr:legumain-like [Oppia nitens]